MLHVEIQIYMIIRSKHYMLSLLTMFLFIAQVFGQNNVVTITCDFDDKSHTISPYLVGTNSIHYEMDDNFWENTEIKPALTEMNCGLLRYPGGGPTSYYHFNDMNGQGWFDTWDPSYDRSLDQPNADFLDLDEYIALCTETGAIPLVGVNIDSGIRYNRVQDGVNEAKALAQYCVDNNYNVTRFYIGNEPYSSHANALTWQEYAAQIKLYSPAIKEVIPHAEIIINWRHDVRRNDVWLLLEDVAEHIDVYDAHWYWSWGSVTFDKWKNELPMDSNSNSAVKESYTGEIEYFHQKKARYFNLRNLKLACLEWNIGQSVDIASRPEIYQSAIMQSEMLMQFMDGGLDMAALWAIYWPNNKPEVAEKSNSRYIAHPVNNFEISPNVEMFGLMSAAGGKSKYASISSSNKVYPLTVSNEDSSETFIYLLNKSQNESSIAVSAPKSNDCNLKIFSTDDIAMTDGSLKTASVTYNDNLGVYQFSMPAYSLARLRIGVLESSLSTEYLDKNSLVIYPNPSKSIVNVLGTKRIDKDEFINLLGQKSLSIKVKDLQNQLDVSSLQKGIYIMNVFVDGIISSYKFVKE